MKVEEAIRQFVAEHGEYQILENFTPEGMKDIRCLGVYMDAETSYMEFFMELTGFFDEKEVDDPDFLLEGASVEAAGDETVVFFPAITER